MTTSDSASTEQRLSTADFAAAADRRAPSQAVAGDPAPVPAKPADHAERMASQPGAAAETPRQTPLFASTQAEEFRGRWSDIQTSFVDEPRQAVEQADTLVAEVMQRLAQVFAEERSKLEQAWDSGQKTDTEELRQALRRYRSFFDRLLSL